VHYTARLLEWTVDKLTDKVRKTRNLRTINCALHPRVNVGRLYVSRGKSGKGMALIEECATIKECSVSDYIRTSTETIH